MAPRTRETRQTCGSSAALPAHYVRSGNDPAERILSRDRELFEAFFRTAAGRGTTHAARLSAARSFDLYRREPSDHAATAWYVPWRPVAQRDLSELRVPPPKCAGQPAAHV